MSDLIECLDGLTAEDIMRVTAKTANGQPFYILTSGLGGFCTEYQRIYDDLSGIGTPPSAAIAAAQNTMVCGLVDDGVWAKLDIFYMFAQTTNAGGEALMNWVTSGLFNAVAVAAPTFTALEGFTGNGVNQYINTAWTPSADGVNFQKDDASIGVYCRLNIQEDSMAMGVTAAADGAYIYPRYATIANRTLSLLNDDTFSQVVNNDSRGMFITSRVVATDKDIYKNKVGTNQVEASTNMPNNPLYILAGRLGANPGEFSTNQVSMAFAGGGFTQADVDNMTDRFETYMDSNGKGVIP